MRILAIVLVVACGGSNQQASPPANTADSKAQPDGKRRERPDCVDAIEGWFFAAGVQPRSPDNATDAQVEEGIATMRAHQQVLVDGCQQDGWSTQARDCFKNLSGSMAPEAGPPQPVEGCKGMLAKPQQDALKKRIAQTGETALQ